VDQRVVKNEQRIVAPIMFGLAALDKHVGVLRRRQIIQYPQGQQQWAEM
jgi:hypothetical protein